ncbi:hypothetical protein M8C21_015853, partial [Ambrosia artemisiifolia]
MFEKPVCYPGCRVNTKDNPNCFCGLIPPPNGNRKTGLWQKTSEIVSSLGADPSKDLRDSLDTPAGLTNLGATCYANSILQFLYMNKSFREGVLSVEPEALEQQPVLNQIARLFAQLHASKMAFFLRPEALFKISFVETTTKKKITSAFSFPGQVDMARWLSEQSDSEMLYDLSAVLIHKGSAVNSGHYVAHIKDQDTGLWWEFDDELVSDLGQHPFGGSSSNMSTKPVQSCSAEPNSVVNGNHMDASSSGTNAHVQTFSSTDAYMLMYSLRNQTSGDRKPQMGSAECKLKDDAYLPPHLLKEVSELNKSYVESCEQYKIKKDAKLTLINERRQEVRSVLSEAVVQSPVESFWWISVDWLRQWADSIIPTQIDNTPIQCLHGKVPVSKISSMKRLSAKAWNTIFSKYEGGPALGEDDCCIECLMETARTTVSADSYRDGRTSMRELAELALAGKCSDGQLLSQWVRRRNVDLPCEADTGPTASIRCPHGSLMPEQAPGAKRALVPENLWLFIYKSANEVKPDDMIGCSVFPSDSDVCPQCCVELSEVTCMEDSLRDFKLKQRQSHEKLALGKTVSLSSENKYYLLPTSWLSKWRCYVTAVGKNASSTEEPEDLNAAIESLKCEQHSRLLHRPPSLVRKRGLILQKAPNVDELTIITEDDWTSFCKEWNCNEEKGIFAEIGLSNSVEDNLLGMSEDTPITEDNVNSLDDANGETESQGPTVKTYPEVCEDCIGERESCELVRKLNYCNEDICICFVRGKEPPKYILEGSGNLLEPNNRRISKRSRRTSYGNSVNLNVSGTTTLYELKMMIWQSFGIVKENQILHKGSKIVDGETATLADVCIFPGDVLWVTDSEIHENRDIAEELSDTKMEVQQSEGGDCKFMRIQGRLLMMFLPFLKSSTYDIPISGCVVVVAL